MASSQLVKPDTDEELPSNVSSLSQLQTLPNECKSGETKRPLRHVDDRGHVHHYALNPMLYSVALILMVELVERSSFYGVYYTQTLYLTGVYDDEWNAGFSSVDAASYVSISTAVAYTTPFIGAVLADMWLGDYKSIIFGSVVLYLPGLLLVALTTVPGLLGQEFNKTALSVAVLFLWPMGTGIIKSVVNVFGARQFHPYLQSSFIESYYVNFYTSINIGALAGITIIPVIAQHNVTLAYTIPVVMLGSGILLFVAGTPRYVKAKPAHNLFQKKMSENSSNNNNNISLMTMFLISSLIIPFCIAYSQMPTTFIVQGTVMTKALGVIDAATMNSLDTISVLVFGYLMGSHLYPALQKRNIKIPTTYKFAIGSSLGALSLVWALVVESMIHKAFSDNQEQVSVLWQAPSYILIGCGEVFAVSAAYEVAFTASSPQTKALSSAINIFCVGGIPNVLCICLYQICQGWFRNSRGDTNIQHIQDYATAHVHKYFCVLVGILIFGVVINMLHPVRNFVYSIEQKAADLVKTTPLTPHSRAARAADEETPLIRRQFGQEPVLYKMGSMRAGPSSKPPPPERHMKAKHIHRLYQPGNKGGYEMKKASRQGTPKSFQHSESR